jgi:hypothetical protein
MISTTSENPTDLGGRSAATGPTVCHVFSGDLGAGAEMVIFNLLSCLNEDPRVRVPRPLPQRGRITDRLRGAGTVTPVIPEARHGLVGILGRAGGSAGS